jgi:xanthine dehydrogenase accessory factor
MNSLKIFAAAQRLQQEAQPFCLVSVLRVQPPTPVRAGDKAIVTAERIVEGWIGGGCAQPAVMRTVRKALVDNRARIIRIAPAEDGESRKLGDVLEFGMTCHSGGTLELFVDPVLPETRLTVIGDSPVATALAALAPRVGLQVAVLAQGADPACFPDAKQVLSNDDPAEVTKHIAPGSFVVVATQGRRDLLGLRAALGLEARQVFFVASNRKAQILKESLIEAGHDAQQVSAIVAPAGAPIGARTPEEVALSVLAAVVAARHGTDPQNPSLSAAVPTRESLATMPSVAGSTPSKAGSQAEARPSSESCCTD